MHIQLNDQRIIFIFLSKPLYSLNQTLRKKSVEKDSNLHAVQYSTNQDSITQYSTAQYTTRNSLQ